MSLNRLHVREACEGCYKAHVRCDKGKPCPRCKRLGISCNVLVRRPIGPSYREKVAVEGLLQLSEFVVIVE